MNSLVEYLAEKAKENEQEYFNGDFKSFIKEHFHQFKQLFNSHIAIPEVLQLKSFKDVESLWSDSELLTLIYPVISDVATTIKQNKPNDVFQNDIPATETEKKYFILLHEKAIIPLKFITHLMLGKELIEEPLNVKELSRFTSAQMQEMIKILEFLFLGDEIEDYIDKQTKK
ncbi:MAG: hypothetical protein QXP36_00030 [Conexivisphaerales archaeon]